METKTARRQTYDVQFVQVTDENIQEVAEWCGGTVVTEGKDPYIKINDLTARNQHQTKAFVGSIVTQRGTTFKRFSEKAFWATYDLLDTVEVARSAETGEFVSHEEAEKNPDTTVVEEVKVIRDTKLDSVSLVSEKPDPSKGVYPVEVVSDGVDPKTLGETPVEDLRTDS